MNLLYIGAGFVGATSAAVSADSGHRTLVFDINTERIGLLGSQDRDQIESCLFEKGLGDLLVRNRERIRFTSVYADVEAFLDAADAVFMCLPTPEIGETGESDLSFYYAAAEKLAAALTKRNSGAQSKYVVVVNRSTVPIDMVDQTTALLERAGVKQVGVVSNPEFLVEGKAVNDSLKPERMVIGAWKEEDFAVMRQVYQRFYDAPTVEYIEVNPKEAAAGKLLANFYLLSKLSLCFDVLGRTCEAYGDLRFEQVRTILTTDSRLGLGGWGFYNSVYAGGSCLNKDTRSLIHQLESVGKKAPLVQETYLANRRQLEDFVTRAETEAGMDWNGKTVAIIGLAFKRDTNDVRNSASVEIAQMLTGTHAGVTLRLYDPVGMPMFQKSFPEGESAIYLPHEFEAIRGADVVIIATDWPQFRGLADMLLTESARPLIMDGRRMLQHRYADLQEAGFDIIAVGSPFMRGKNI